MKFAPLNVNDYQARILCQIPNTEEDRLGHMIPIKGKGILPYCHFELEESSYLSGGRRNPELPGPNGAAAGLGLDPATKVVEFHSVGLSATPLTRHFDLLNPTSVDYEFEWSREEQRDARHRLDQFACVLNARATLPSGKRCTVAFEFTPSESGVQETFWRFRIPRFELSVPFLLVGHAAELRVLLDRSHVAFRPLLKGRTGRERVHLLNQEPQPVRFEFEQASCYSEGRADVVLVEPAAGTLPAHGKLAVDLSFTPREQRASVFNLKCKLENSHKPLNLNVKTEGFVIQTSLLCEDSKTGERIEFSDSSINEIHMGQVK